MRKVAALVLTCVLYCTGASAKKKVDPQLEAELAQITTRGRKLAEYHFAVRHAFEAVKALGGPLGVIHEIVAQKTDQDWVVKFGELSLKGDKFWVAYEATQQEGTDNYKAAENGVPKGDTGYSCPASKAIETARRAFRGGNRPYEAVVLPAESNQFYVYIYPAQTTEGVYPYGGDARYLISADGTTIVESRQMHTSIQQSVPAHVPPGAKFAAGFHSHVLSDLPEDSDILLVLIRKPSSPETVGTENHVFLVNPDGSIKVEK